MIGTAIDGMGTWGDNPVAGVQCAVGACGGIGHRPGA